MLLSLDQRHDLGDHLVQVVRRGVDVRRAVGIVSGAVARPESIRSRASSDSRVASTSPPCSADRRSAWSAGRR